MDLIEQSFYECGMCIKRSVENLLSCHQEVKKSVIINFGDIWDKSGLMDKESDSVGDDDMMAAK